MSDQSRLDAGARLADDLRRIREGRNLTLGDLNAETKIPRSLLESFEEQALFDHPQFNRVYLRSFVRTYATTIGVEPERAADALDNAFQGTYDGSLAEEYLGEAPKPHAPRVAADEPPAGDVESEQVDGDVDMPPPPAEADRRKSEEPPPLDEEWAATSPPSRKVKPESRAPRPPRSSGRRRRRSSGWPVMLSALVGIAVLVWILWMVFGSSDGSSEQTEASMAAADESQQVAEEPPPPPRDIPVLGDSLVFFVVAADAPVDPVRVTVDNDLRRPYWIEQGDSMRFAAANRIVFEERLDVIRLNLQGESYPTDQRDDQGRIVVTRDTAEEFFESLAL